MYHTQIKFIVLLAVILLFGTISYAIADVPAPNVDYGGLYIPEIFPFVSTIAILLTIIIEFPVLLSVIQKTPVKLFFVSAFINIATVPIFNYIYKLTQEKRHFGRFIVYDPNFLSFILLEFIVILIETILLKYLMKLGWSRSFLASLIANTASAVLGFYFFS